MGFLAAIYKLVAPVLNDKDQHPLLLDASGNLKVNVITGGATNILVDDAKYTPATDTVAVVGGEADEAAIDSVDEGDAGAFRMSLRRAQYVQLDDVDTGNSLTKTDDAALAPGARFLPVGGIVDDTATDSADEGDGAVLRLTARRAAVVQLDAGAGGIAKQDDVSTFAPGTDWGIPVGGLVDDTATDTADDGDFVAARYSARRAAMTSMDTLLAGEFQAASQGNSRMRVEPTCAGTRITTATTTTVLSGAGTFVGILIGKHVATGVITVYDNTAASGPILAVITTGAALLSDPPLLALPNIKVTTGITVVTSQAEDITILYRADT